MVRFGSKYSSGSVSSKHNNINNDGYVVIHRDTGTNFDKNHLEDESTDEKHQNDNNLQIDHRLSYNLETNSSDFSNEVFTLTKQLLTNHKEEQPLDETDTLPSEGSKLFYRHNSDSNIEQHTQYDPVSQHVADDNQIKTGTVMEMLKKNDENNNLSTRKTNENGENGIRNHSTPHEEVIESSITIEEITIIEEREEIIEEDQHDDIVEDENQSDNEVGFSIVEGNPQLEFDSIELPKKNENNDEDARKIERKLGPIVVDLKIEANVNYNGNKKRLTSSSTAISDDVFLASELDSPSVKTPTSGNKKHYVFIAPELNETSSSFSDNTFEESRTSVSLLEEIKEIESNLQVDLGAEDIVAKEEKLETSMREKELIKRIEESNVGSSPPLSPVSNKSVDLIPITPKSKKKRRNYFFCGLINDEQETAI